MRPVLGIDQVSQQSERMEERELRVMAAELRTELPSLISDAAERAVIDAAPERALATPAGSAKQALRTAMEPHPATREWLREGAFHRPHV
jgi:hypothetical protein